MANAEITPADSQCPPAPPGLLRWCSGLEPGIAPSFPVAGVGHPVSVGWRHAPAGSVSLSSTTAVAIGPNEFLCPAAPGGRTHLWSACPTSCTSVLHVSPRTASPTVLPRSQRASETTPTDNVYAVHSWWVEGLWPSCCPLPQEAVQTPQPDLSFYCSGPWLTQEAAKPPSTSDQLSGLKLQSGTYPSWYDQPRPVEGNISFVALGARIVPSGCPAWRLLGRLDDESTSPSPSPSPSPSGGLLIYTAQQLADMIGKADWIGKTVLANTLLVGPPEAFESPGVFACQPPDPCQLACLDPAGSNVPVLVGWRDATSDDGVQYDDGNGWYMGEAA